MKGGSAGDYKGNYKGRSDYGPKKGGFESCTMDGNKGVPPGIKGAEGQKQMGPLVTNEGGNKGIPPKSSPSAKAPLD